VARALVIVDVQNDFCDDYVNPIDGHGLPVGGGGAVAHRLGTWLPGVADQYAAIVTTQDWHDDPGAHFARPPAAPNYVDTWPVHCAAGTDGAALHPAVVEALRSLAPLAVRKGALAAAYSGFEGHTVDGHDLHDALAAADVDALDVVGIATDHCVHATAADALRLGYRVRVLVDLCAGVAPDTTADRLADLARRGAEITWS
jgi:nicotinamidase/pyrazinamidase